MIQNVLFLKLLILWLSLSSFLIVILFNVTDVNFNFLILKDLMIYLLILLSLVLFVKDYKVDNSIIIIGLPLFFIILYNFSISYAPLFAKAATIRQIITPFVLMFIGFQFIRNRSDYYSVIKFIIYLFVLLVLFGFIERFTYLWTIVTLEEYFTAKNISLLSIGYPVMFVEPIHLFKESIEVNGIFRVVSTFLDPINFGHSLAVVLPIIYYEKKLFKQELFRYFLIFIFSITLLLTFSKGSMLELFFIFFILNKNVSLMLRGLSTCFMVILVFLISLKHAGFLVHFYGFTNIFDHLTLFGHGLATFGNYAFMFSEGNSINTDVGDSFWGSLIGQLGIFGFIAWIYIFYYIVKDLPYNFYLSRILIAQIIVSSISENAFNLLSIYIIMILIGGYYSLNKNYTKVVYNEN